MKLFSLVFFVFVSHSLFAQQDPDLIKYKAPNYTDQSVLSNGDIYKVEVSKDGIYKISYDYLKNIGIEVDKLNPTNIKIYGNGGGALKQSIDDEYKDDLTELPIYINGEDDNIFNPSDYILFYGEGADKWEFNTGRNFWDYKKNIYSLSNYYFIKISDEKGKRIANQEITTSPSYTTNEIDIFEVHEIDRINLLGNFNKTEGSGQEWYGENISGQSEMDFSNDFKNFKFNVESDITMMLTFAGRDKETKKLSVSVNDKKFESTIASSRIDLPESVYAKKAFIFEKFNLSDNNLTVKVNYNGEKGWLNKIVFNGRKSAVFAGNQIIIVDKNTPKNTISSINMSNLSNDVYVWDITSNEKISNVLISNNKNSIVFNSTNSNRFIAFNKKGDFLIPGKSQKIDNQNIHGILDAEMLVIYPKEFEESAKRFTEYRSEKSNLNVYSIELPKIFNEFSCGKYDPTAIRDFVKMLKVKNDGFKYLLLFGDGSYDPRGITTKEDNFIPVYETKKSLDPIHSFPSDDYFGLLSYGDGANLIGKLDVGIGRFPVRSKKQAEVIVQKIIDYETDIKHFGDWVNSISLSADDVDDESWDITHFHGAERIYKNITSKYPEFNINKIYLDAYIQENNAGGQRYPDANRAINSSFFKGQLMYVYVGHGGAKGLAQERVMKINDIKSWNNKYKLPLLITATCSFTGYDDPDINTAGEEAFLKEKGGVIALFSTVRAVFASSNDALMKTTFDAFFKNESSKHLPIGDIIKIAKNETSDTQNKRKFLLFGDPSLQLKFPKHKVITTKVNNFPVDGENIIDTLSAMEKVVIEGYIAKDSTDLDDSFNGELTLTLYDKNQKLKTYSNDHKENNNLKKEFLSQKNILFKGQAEIINGKFSITFILPKDINYKYGQGKISYYALDKNLEQATGFFKGISIGGTAKNIVADNIGPEIDLYMNDQNFAFGGITNSEPVLLGFLEDESGINVSSSSIGHELSGEMDNELDNRLLLNEFYKSQLNNYKKGSFRYPLSKLNPGKHTIKVEAWDIFNNKSEKNIEFIVVDKSKNTLSHVLNYPNPFSTITSFNFEHDLPDNNLDIIINIFTLSGKIVKTIRHSTLTEGFRISDIEWNGTDDFGINLANGIYIYKIKVFSTEYNITRESKFEKLVILK